MAEKVYTQFNSHVKSVGIGVGSAAMEVYSGAITVTTVEGYSVGDEVHVSIVIEKIEE